MDPYVFCAHCSRKLILDTFISVRICIVSLFLFFSIQIQDQFSEKIKEIFWKLTAMGTIIENPKNRFVGSFWCLACLELKNTSYCSIREGSLPNIDVNPFVESLADITAFLQVLTLVCFLNECHSFSHNFRGGN